MKFVPDIIEDFLSGLDYTAEIWDTVFDGTNTTVTVYNVMHLRPGLFVQFSSLLLSVISVSYSLNTFKVSGDMTGETEVIFPKLHFFHGTTMAANGELSRLDDPAKVPMCYLHEVIREELGGPTSRVSRANIRLFFLDVANYGDWNTDQHYEKVIRPMRNFSDYFRVELAKNNKNFRLENSTLYTHVKFGFLNQRGQFESIFNSRLSGIEMQVELLISECNTNRGLNSEKPTSLVPVGLEEILEAILIG